MDEFWISFCISFETNNCDLNLPHFFAVLVTEKYQTADDVNGQSETRSHGSYSYTTENANDFYSARSDSKVRRGPKGDTGEKGEPGRDGLNGATGVSGPPGHVFMLPVMYQLVVVAYKEF